MTDKPAPKRVRSRVPKGEPVTEALSLKIDSSDLQRVLDEARSDLADSFPPSLTAADLRAELDSLSTTRTQVVGAITATAEQHARLTSDLTRVDGALQIVGQLIERLEAKAT